MHFRKGTKMQKINVYLKAGVTKIYGQLFVYYYNIPQFKRNNNKQANMKEFHYLKKYIMTQHYIE